MPPPDPILDRQSIEQLAEQGYLPGPLFDRALTLAGIVPDGARWRQFLDRLLLIAGCTFIAAAIIFFIAYNWQEMGRFLKFGLLEAALVLSVAASIAWRNDPLRRQASLLLTVLLVGPLLALVGQTYQTGADTYELFLAWAALSLPWAFLAAWRPVWCWWVSIANAALWLYFAEVGLLGWWVPLIFATHHIVLSLLTANALLLILAEWAGRRGWISGRFHTLERLLALLVIGAATFLHLLFLFERIGVPEWLWLIALATYIIVWAAYRWGRLDVVILSMWATAVIVVILCTVGKQVLKGRDEAAGFLLLGILAIGLSAAAALWLRRLSQHAAAKAQEAL
ncbi:MAG: DUF2157 domain-containing protein [Betaproteobacteria bacterium]|nr:DUF2157 domain-containing protein [Betaproteobacteria bacterium]